MVSRLTSKFVTHFKFIFLSGVREESSFLLMHLDVQFYQPHSWKLLIFLLCLFLVLLSRISSSHIYGSSGIFVLLHWFHVPVASTMLL